MDEENKTLAPSNDGQAPQPPAPSGQQDGQADDKSVDVQEDIPEKFKGKSATEIAKSYIELEKKLGDHSKEVKMTRDQLAQWEALGRVLESNPELYKQVEGAIEQMSGGKGESDDKQPPKDDTRVATENIIVNNFEKQFGIDLLPSEDRLGLHKKIGEELVEMLDPGGNKTIKQVMADIPLDKLDKYLSKAYRLATVNDERERARIQGLLEARQNREASFGGFASSSISGKQPQLTEEEKNVARKMNISDEDYLKEKQALEN